MAKNGETTKYRVGELEKDTDNMSKDLKMILENHLPHIQSEIASLKSRQIVGTGIIIAAVGLAVALAKFI